MNKHVNDHTAGAASGPLSRIRGWPLKYDILCGRGAKSTLNRLPALSAAERILVADRRVLELHPAVLSALPQLAAPPFIFEPGEAAKSLSELSRLWDHLAEARVGRDGLIIALGGGVASDLAGFAAATWMRGIPYINLPTTLEAAIDAAIGGKAAINLSHGKNLVGSFHPPSAVVIDTDFLSTLPQREYVAALAESIKHGLIRDAAFLAWQADRMPDILSRDPDVLIELITRNCRIKADVVAQDEHEAGLREILNCGHTIGHAIEHVCGYALRHGECVALGMLAENQIAAARGALDGESVRRIGALIASAGLPRLLPTGLDPEAIVAACGSDKKNRAGKVRCALAVGIGHAATVEVTEAELRDGLQAIMVGA